MARVRKDTPSVIMRALAHSDKGLLRASSWWGLETPARLPKACQYYQRTDISRSSTAKHGKSKHAATRAA